MGRTTVNWDKHEVTVKEFDGTLIHHFKIPGTYMNSLTFINSEGILAITGDFGNWIFCREFHPSPDGSVSDMYWLEKLRISSCQEPHKYDGDTTVKQLNDRIEEIKNEFPEWEESDYYKKMIEYYNDLFSYTDNEYEYITEAMNLPDKMDYDDIIVGKVLNPWLPIIFDAFEEICHRMKTN